MKIIFLGTPEFATEPLKTLIENFDVVAVVSQPDKPVGRKQKLVPTPVKQVATENNIPCFQFNSISKEGYEILKSYNADLFVTCAYGQMLSKEILDIPKLGVFNIHGSILPKYRGASPIQWSIINGEEKTGITILKSDVGMDDGDILLCDYINISSSLTAEELFKELSILSKSSILKAVNLLNSGNYNLTKQNELEATFTKKLTKEMSFVNFNNDSKTVKNYINGINMWPVAKVKVDGFNLKVYKAIELNNNEIENLNLTNLEKAGTVVVSNNKKGLIVKCLTGYIRLLEIQPENGKRMQDVNFLNGKEIKVGSIINNE